MAHPHARLWQATGKPLHRAKAEGRMQGIQAAQDPVHGALPFEFMRDTADTANWNLYDMMEAADRLVAAGNRVPGMCP